MLPRSPHRAATNAMLPARGYHATYALDTSCCIMCCCCVAPAGAGVVAVATLDVAMAPEDLWTAFLCFASFGSREVKTGCWVSRRTVSTELHVGHIVHFETPKLAMCFSWCP